MIKLKKVSGEDIFINENYIESIETATDTTVKIHNGTTFVTQENAEEIMALIQDWEHQKRMRDNKDNTL